MVTRRRMMMVTISRVADRREMRTSTLRRTMMKIKTMMRCKS